MKITIHQSGGFLGGECNIEIAEGSFKATRKHREQHVNGQYMLDHVQQEQLGHLAERLIEVRGQVQPLEDYPPSDARVSDITLENGKDRVHLTVGSGYSAPDEVWEFTAVVDQLVDSALYGSVK